MNYVLLAQQSIRAIRGKRSQLAFSRRLGLRSNAVAGWEAGRRFPTGERFFFACTRVGIDLRRHMARFHPSGVDLAPSSGAAKQALSRSDVLTWLNQLKGQLSIGTIAERCSCSRYAVGRWLAGKTEPRLPDFLRLIDAMTNRVVDLLSLLLGDAVPESVALEQRRRQALRQLAFDEPWTEALLRIIESVPYDQALVHEPHWMANRLAIDVETVLRCLELLVDAKIIRWDGRKYRSESELTIDTGQERERFLSLRRHWASVVSQRLDDPQEADLGSYNVFSCSRADLERIRKLHVDYYLEVRNIIAASAPCEVVGLLQLSLFEWPLDN